jgi:hypothetical protein
MGRKPKDIERNIKIILNTPTIEICTALKEDYLQRKKETISEYEALKKIHHEEDNPPKTLNCCIKLLLDELAWIDKAITRVNTWITKGEAQ